MERIASIRQRNEEAERQADITLEEDDKDADADDPLKDDEPTAASSKPLKSSSAPRYKKLIDHQPILLNHQPSHAARMLVLTIAVVSLVVVLTGAAIMWFVYVRRNDPDR